MSSGDHNGSGMGGGNHNPLESCHKLDSLKSSWDDLLIKQFKAVLKQQGGAEEKFLELD